MADEKKQPELRPYEFPWYRRAGHALTDMIYGENATPQQGEWVQKFTGPENPFNFPAQITHGSENVMQGYRSGDPLLMGAGALEAGLASVIPAYAGFSVAAAPFRAAARQRAARDAAEAAKGPWGNPGMFEEHLDRPQAPRHELNQPKNTPKRQRSYKEMNSEYEDLENEAKNFMMPGRGEPPTLGDVSMGPDGQFYGTLEPRSRSDGNRWWYPREFENYDRAKNAWESYSRYGGYYPGSKAPQQPIEGLADDVVRFGRNNENIPGVYEQAEALAQRLRGIDAAQAPEREALRKQFNNWDNSTGFGYNRQLFKDVEKANPGLEPNRIGDYTRHGHRYLDDARKFTKGDDHYIGDGNDHNALRRILVNEFGADPNDPASIEKAYQAFWAQERARRAAGQRTIHDEEMIRDQVEQDNWYRQRYGSGYTKDEYEDMAMEDINAIKQRIAEQKKRLGIGDGGLGDFGDRMERSPRMRGIADSVFRYGPAAATGAGIAYGLGIGERSPPEEDTSSHFAAPKGLQQSSTPIGPAVPDSDYLRYATQKGIDDAEGDKLSGTFRAAGHGIVGIPTTMMMPGWWKLPMGAFQAFSALGGLADRRKAEDRRQTFEAQKKGYVDRLPELDPDTFVD